MPNSVKYGFDIGGTKIELAIFDETMQLIHSERIQTPTSNYTEFLDAVIALVHKADDISGQKGSVGIGLPGIVNPKTRTQLCVNVPCLKDQPLVDDLIKQLNRSVALENDGRCFALSEASSAQTKPFSTVLGAILGTGAGGGLVVNGKLFKGANGLAGEWGHIPMSANLIHKHQLPLFKCNCGLIGCNERYVSGTGLADLLNHFDSPVKTVPEFVARLEQFDSEATKIFDVYTDLLGASFASLQLLFDIDAFVLGGGLSNIQQIYHALPEKLTNWLLPSITPAVILPPVYGDSSGVRGAALLHG